MSDYSELKRLAEAATPGPWQTELAYPIIQPAYPARGSIASALIWQDAHFIAAANPATVLVLIKEIDGLREEVEIDNKIIAERDRLLNAIPECAAHGQCVPHAIQWVKDVQVENSQLLEERDQLRAENERLQQFEAAYTEWSDKTDWVQETVHWSELGMHRADVLHKRCRDGAFHQQAQADRIKVLMDEVETLTSQVKALQSDANSYQSGYDAGRAAAKAHADSWRAEAEALREFKRHMVEMREADGFKSWAEVLVEIDKLRVEAEVLCKGATPLDPVTGDQLPAIGSKVLIHLGRSDAWVEHTVVGYYAWGDLDGNQSLHRVFVRVRDADGYLNARLLKDVRTQVAMGKESSHD